MIALRSQVPGTSTGGIGLNVLAAAFLLATAPLHADEVTALVLVNATDNSDIRTLVDNDILDLDTLPTPDLNIRAETSPATAGSVVFSLTGAETYNRTENTAPFTFRGDSGGNYNDWTPTTGSYTLTATAYTESGGAGTAGTPYTIDFTVTGEAAPPPPPPPPPPPDPAPSSGFGPRILFIRGGAGTGGFLEGGADTQLSDITNDATTTGNHGWFEFASLLQSEGYTTDQIIEDPDVPVDLPGMTLDNYALIIFGSNNAAYPTAAVDAVESYVRNGGAALFISDANWGSDWDDASDSDQPFVGRFGWEMNQDNGTYRIDASEYLDPTHPILRGVGAFDGEGVTPITVVDTTVPGVTTTILATAEGQVRRNTVDGQGPTSAATANDAALVVANAGSGRVAGHFDRNTFFNANGAGTWLMREDGPLNNRLYARNLVRWLVFGDEPAVQINGILRQWHDVEVTFSGPFTSEADTPNPFQDYRLDVTFTHESGSPVLEVPGYFAADGNAAETSASAGDRWRVHFAPPETGDWDWEARFLTGTGVAIADDLTTAVSTAFDGATGTLTILPTDKTGRDHRGKGRLVYTGERYPRFAGTGEPFLKGGAGSPENLLGYIDFDQTPDYRHEYAPHLGDWNPGGPQWQGGKGRSLIGAFNYLAGEGMNSVYFLLNNVQGDGKDVWPWVSDTNFERYDVSKLAQWEILFDHSDAIGIHLHMFLQETENDQMLDGGDLGPTRRLYHREIVARFAHHLAVTWNMGEENTNTEAQRKAFATDVRGLDPYDHPIAIHTYPGQKNVVYTPLLGYPDYEVASLQSSVTKMVNDTEQWLEDSAAAGRQWIVAADEIGPANTGAKPDSADPDHDGIRVDPLWGHLLAGGVGVEWYFGYGFPNDDLDCEDWRSRDLLWDQTRHALEFFRNELPFDEMEPDDTLVDGDARCLAKAGEIYVVQLPEGGTTTLDLGGSTDAFEIYWFDPKGGGALQSGSVANVVGTGVPVALGDPPSRPTGDWIVLVRNCDLYGGANCGVGASVEAWLLLDS